MSLNEMGRDEQDLRENLQNVRYDLAACTGYCHCIQRILQKLAEGRKGVTEEQKDAAKDLAEDLELYIEGMRSLQRRFVDAFPQRELRIIE